MELIGGCRGAVGGRGKRSLSDRAHNGESSFHLVLTSIQAGDIGL